MNVKAGIVMLLAGAMALATAGQAARAQEVGQTRTVSQDQGDHTRAEGQIRFRYHEYRYRTEAWEQNGTQSVASTHTETQWVPDLSLADLLTWDGSPVALNGVPVNGYAVPWQYWDCGYYYGSGFNFSHNIDLQAIDAVLGNPSYLNDGDVYYGRNYGNRPQNKLDWLRRFDTVAGSGASSYISTPDAENTTSSLLEAGRLADIYLLLAAGQSPPRNTLTGWFHAEGYAFPYTIAFTMPAILQEIKTIFQLGIDTETPICLDLNHDGHIGVTGKSTAAVRAPGNDFVRAGSVPFDLDGFGRRHRYEWLNGDGDGFLVYDPHGMVEKAARKGGQIDGRALFGNAIGYDNGFQKLAVLTDRAKVASRQLKGLPALSETAATGAALADLKVWIDRNHDGRVQASELYSLKSLGITEIGLVPQLVKNRFGEIRVVSYFIQHGKRYLSEDVFFAEDPAQAHGTTQSP